MKTTIYIALMVLVVGCGKPDRSGPDGGGDAGCRFDSECPEGLRCNTNTGVCESIPDTCNTDEDCQPWYCNLYTETCQEDPFEGDCQNDEECRLAFGSDRIDLVIRDDGVGFDPAAVDPDRDGLTGMRERAAMIGATLKVHSRPGGGSRIWCSLER